MKCSNESRPRSVGFSVPGILMNASNRSVSVTTFDPQSSRRNRGLHASTVPTSRARCWYSLSQQRCCLESSQCLYSFLRWDSSRGLGGFPGTMRLLGSAIPLLRYQSAASSCDSNRWVTCSTAVRRRCGFSEFPNRDFLVMYATTSFSSSRGANFPFRQRQVIAGNGCSKSGSRRIEPSMNGGRLSSSDASRPLRVQTSGVYVTRKCWRGCEFIASEYVPDFAAIPAEVLQ